MTNFSINFSMDWNKPHVKLKATNQNDTITGSTKGGTLELIGLAGNDSTYVNSMNGLNFIDNGSGDDYNQINSLFSQISAFNGEGNDYSVLNGNFNTNAVWGNEGNDSMSINGNFNTSRFSGGAGNDTLYLTNPDNYNNSTFFEGGSGYDRVVLSGAPSDYNYSTVNEYGNDYPIFTDIRGNSIRLGSDVEEIAFTNPVASQNPYANNNQTPESIFTSFMNMFMQFCNAMMNGFNNNQQNNPVPYNNNNYNPQPINNNSGVTAIATTQERNNPITVPAPPDLSSMINNQPVATQRPVIDQAETEALKARDPVGHTFTRPAETPATHQQSGTLAQDAQSKKSDSRKLTSDDANIKFTSSDVDHQELEVNTRSGNIDVDIADTGVFNQHGDTAKVKSNSDTGDQKVVVRDKETTTGRVTSTTGSIDVEVRDDYRNQQGDRVDLATANGSGNTQVKVKKVSDVALTSVADQGGSVTHEVKDAKKVVDVAKVKGDGAKAIVRAEGVDGPAAIRTSAEGAGAKAESVAVEVKKDAVVESEAKGTGAQAKAVAGGTATGGRDEGIKRAQAGATESASSEATVEKAKTGRADATATGQGDATTRLRGVQAGVARTEVEDGDAEAKSAHDSKKGQKLAELQAIASGPQGTATTEAENCEHAVHVARTTNGSILETEKGRIETSSMSGTSQDASIEQRSVARKEARLSAGINSGQGKKLTQVSSQGNDHLNATIRGTGNAGIQASGDGNDNIGITVGGQNNSHRMVGGKGNDTSRVAFEANSTGNTVLVQDDVSGKAGDDTDTIKVDFTAQGNRNNTVIVDPGRNQRVFYGASIRDDIVEVTVPNIQDYDNYRPTPERSDIKGMLRGRRDGNTVMIGHQVKKVILKDPYGNVREVKVE